MDDKVDCTVGCSVDRTVPDDNVDYSVDRSVDRTVPDGRQSRLPRRLHRRVFRRSDGFLQNDNVHCSVDHTVTCSADRTVPDG